MISIFFLRVKELNQQMPDSTDGDSVALVLDAVTHKLL